MPVLHPLRLLKSMTCGDDTRSVNAQGTETNELVVANLALVGYHVSSMLSRVPSYVSRSDLASAGHLALVQAARSYDASTGVPFGRYASLRIRGALVDELRGMDWISRGARRRVRRVNEVADELTASLGRVPSREELAEALGVGVDEVDTARGDAEVRVLSLDGADGTAAQTLACEEAGPEESLVASERLHYMRAGVESLPERLRHVVEQLFFHDRPVVELAVEMGVTQSRISQLRTEALALLKDGMNASLDPQLVPEGERPDGVAERRRRTYFAQVAARAAQHAQAGTLDVVPTQRSRHTSLHDGFDVAAVHLGDLTGERTLAVG